MHKAEALPDELVEGLLVLRVVQSVTRDEPRAAVLLPDRGVEVLAVQVVAVDVHEAKALADELVEGLLVLSVVQPVAGDECWPTVCRPDGGVEVLSVHAIAIDVNEAEALPDELIERLLVLGVGQPVAGDPTAEGNRDAARELGRSGHVLPAASRAR